MMQKRSFKYILYISLAFNIAFLGGFAYRIFFSPFRHPGFPPPEMKPPVKNFFFEKKDEMQVFGQDFMKCKKKFIDSLAEPEFNEEKSLELMQNSVDKHMIMESEIGKSLIELRKKMSAKEAAKMFGNMAEQEGRFRKPFEKPFQRRRFN
jgi:hypothetical protein